MDNYRELKIRCDLGFRHLLLFQRPHIRLHLETIGRHSAIHLCTNLKNNPKTCRNPSPGSEAIVLISYLTTNSDFLDPRETSIQILTSSYSLQ